MPHTRQRMPDDPHPRARGYRWLSRIGLWGFVFFLVKGLAWLVVPVLLANGLSD